MLLPDAIREGPLVQVTLSAVYILVRFLFVAPFLFLLVFGSASCGVVFHEVLLVGEVPRLVRRRGAQGPGRGHVDRFLKYP